MTSAEPLRVAMIGHAFMGRAHTQAWKTAGRFFALPRPVETAVIVGHNAERATKAAEALEWQESSDDWRATIARDDIDIVDICTPGDTHAEVAIAALQAGKHVMCEKPLANTVAEAEAMTSAAEEAFARGVVSMCGFTYRRTPALAYAKQLVAQGKLGTIRHIRGVYLQDWLSDPMSPWSWRMDKELAGSGALGDIGAHVVDAAEYVTGLTVRGVSGMLETFVTERPVAGGIEGGLGGRGAEGAEMKPVTVDDAAVFTARFSDADGHPSNAVATFEATRFALGRKNALRLEINGDQGSLAFDFEDMNALDYFDGSRPAEEQGFTRILVTEPTHPWTGNWWPPGHGLGYEHGFTHQVVDLVSAIDSATQPRPSFADALHINKVLAAVQDSAWHESRFTLV